MKLSFLSPILIIVKIEEGNIGYLVVLYFIKLIVD